MQKQAEENSQPVEESKVKENGSCEETQTENGVNPKALSKREKKELRRQQQTKQEKKDKKTDDDEEESNETKKRTKNKENETGK